MSGIFESDMSGSGLFLPNGLDGTTGEYLLPPLRESQLGALARGEDMDPEHLEELRWWFEQHQKKWSVISGIDSSDLSQAGWGVIFAHGVEDEGGEASREEVREALQPLLEHRRTQAGSLFREFRGQDAPAPGESKLAFLARHGAGPGPVDPRRVPYYLLLVGSPETIPYAFQYQLGMQYAVGRLHFDGPLRLARYAAYAQSVVAREKLSPQPPEPSTKRPVAFFGTSHDPATSASSSLLVAPLARHVEREHPKWPVCTFVGDSATKVCLGRLLGHGLDIEKSDTTGVGEAPPALVFTATHGLGFPCGDARQVQEQGALVCQDWPGPGAMDSASGRAERPVSRGRATRPSREEYFAAEDVEEGTPPQGLIAFHFACYGIGTPRLDDFAGRVTGRMSQIAPRNFVASLPQRLLGHEKGGALAIVGHVERAWGFSFAWPGAGAQLASFVSVLNALLRGGRVGAACEPFGVRYAELSSELSALLDEISWGAAPDDRVMSQLWTARNDARNTVILGDPAVRLPDGVMESTLKQKEIRP